MKGDGILRWASFSQSEMMIVMRSKDALEGCNARNGLATLERHWIWVGGREARQRKRGLLNVVLVWILFDVSDTEVRFVDVLTRCRWMYASTVAYVVDANPGRSCSAVAANSSFLGALAFITTMIAVPLQDAVGDGWLYTVFAVLVVVMELLIVLVLHKGVSWREREAER